MFELNVRFKEHKCVHTYRKRKVSAMIPCKRIKSIQNYKSFSFLTQPHCLTIGRWKQQDLIMYVIDALAWAPGCYPLFCVFWSPLSKILVFFLIVPAANTSFVNYSRRFFSNRINNAEKQVMSSPSTFLHKVQFV